MINKKRVLAVSVVLTLSVMLLYPRASAEEVTPQFTIKFDDYYYDSDELPIKSFEYAEQNNAAGMTMKATRPEMADILVTRVIDENSPTLFIDCAKGRLIPEVIIHVYYPGSSMFSGPDVEIRLREVSITSYTVVGDEVTNPPMEGFTLGYRTIYYSVTDGESLTTRGWDLLKNNQI